MLLVENRRKNPTSQAVCSERAQELEETHPVEDLGRPHPEVLVVDDIEGGSQAESSLRKCTEQVAKDVQRWEEALWHHRTAFLIGLDSPRIHVGRDPIGSQPI